MFVRVRMTRGRLVLGLVSAMVMVLVLWIVWIFVEPPFGGPPDDHVAATDSRVCRQTSGNNDPLADVTQHFDLVLPRGATHVVFSASVGGLQGESDLDLRFTTTPAGLAAFLSASQLARPTATTAVTTGAWTTMGPGTQPTGAQGPCGLNPPANQHMVYTQDRPDGPMGKNPRSAAVDMTDPAHPTVWVSALDL
jgi:hypothetical protein